MADTYFTEDHEWIRVDGDIARVGITKYAAEQLGDIVFVELPEIGKNAGKGDEIAVVESVKSASEIYAPAPGEVSGANAALEDAPETVNGDPEGEGWFFEIKLSDTDAVSGLMDADAYAKYVEGL